MPNNKLNVSIDILGLQGAERVKNKAGEDCVLIILPKSRLNAHANGKVYLSLDVSSNRDGEDKFGNTHFVAEGATKEERMQKVRLKIVGNAKEFVFGNSGGGGYKPSGNARPMPKTPIPDSEQGDQDIPF